ncbi:MAG: oligopeptidase A, partial [Gammaproteobacteria bacterium]|nr:oligopeptidase A [Gammaproteobacteria bacterium]
MTIETNTLLEMDDLPPFSRIRVEEVTPALDEVLAANRKGVAQLLLEAGESPTWESLLAPLEGLEDRLNRLWSPVSHLNGVMNSPELRQVVDDAQLKLSDYWTEMGQNEALYHAYRRIRESEAFSRLDCAQQRVIDNALRDFRLSGIALPAAEKERYKSMMAELSQLTTRYSNNLLDATNGWHKGLAAETLLAGVPHSGRALMRQAAESAGEEGWRITLDFPSYFAIITHADNRELRQEIYCAYTTRASDQGPQAGQWDNSPLMEQILHIRYELAQLLGFNSYAERSLATKMAEDPEQVLTFLRDLARRALPMARQELQEVTVFAKEQGLAEPLQAWDMSYYSEKLRQSRYAISQEDLRPYFALPRVVEGLFALVERLFGVSVSPASADLWHKDATFYEIYDGAGGIRGRFYLDPYARQKKRGGAWMDVALARR